MTTMLQMVIGMQDLITEHPEMASYEVKVVDSTKSEEIGETVKGKCMFFGQDDDRKIFDLYVNVSDDDVSHSGIAQVDEIADYTEASNMIQMLRATHHAQKHINKYLSELVIRYGGELYHQFKLNYDEDTVTCVNVRNNKSRYGFTWAGLIMHIQDGTAEVI